MKGLSRLKFKLSDAYGVDMGTYRTLIHRKGHGIVLDEPSAISVNKRTYRIVSTGESAINMHGRTPSHIEVVNPIQEGTISDFSNAEKMMEIYLNKARRGRHNFLSFPPFVVVGAPAEITNVETIAIMDIFHNLGISDIFVVKSVIAGAVGVGEPIYDPIGITIIDIGAGTTDIAIISLGGIISSKTLKIAGNNLSQDIIEYIRQEFRILIGFQTADMIKMKLANMKPTGEREQIIRGRDLETGHPKEVRINDIDIFTAIKPPIDSIIGSLKNMIEESPPEIMSDIIARGINLIGGGANMKGLGSYMEESLGVPVSVPEDPASIVVRGIGLITEYLQNYRPILHSNKDDLPLV